MTAPGVQTGTHVDVRAWAALRHTAVGKYEGGSGVWDARLDLTCLVGDKRTWAEFPRSMLASEGVVEETVHPGAGVRVVGARLKTGEQLAAFLTLLENLASEPPDTLEPGAYDIGVHLGDIGREQIYGND